MIDYYKKKAKECFNKYQKAIDSGNTKKAEYYMKEFLIYDKTAKAGE